jgi:hypothetical protein
LQLKIHVVEERLYALHIRFRLSRDNGAVIHERVVERDVGVEWTLGFCRLVLVNLGRREESVHRTAVLLRKLLELLALLGHLCHD